MCWSFSLKALCPSLPDLRISGGGMGSWGNAMSLPPSSPHFWWCSAQVPWALCPYLSPQVEHLENPLRSGCWHCCFSVLRALEYLECLHEPKEMPTNESPNQVSQIHYRSCWDTLYRPANPVLCLDLRPKKDSRVDRDIKGLIDGMSYISEVKGSWWWKVVAEPWTDARILGF